MFTEQIYHILYTLSTSAATAHNTPNNDAHSIDRATRKRMNRLLLGSLNPAALFIFDSGGGIALFGGTLGVMPEPAN
jgi:hypothetical protein